MKKSQLIAISVAIVLVAGIYFLGRTVAVKKISPASNQPEGKSKTEGQVSIDTFLVLAKKKLSAEQVLRINTLEHSISRGDIKDQQIKVYHDLAHFWSDSANAFEPYAWYLAEAARLENSEKTLNFAAHLFLDNLQRDEVVERRKWKALQAKDLLERSLRINPDNDSTKVALGACYLFGNISDTPMEGILKIREIAEKDSTNTYAQMMLGKASMLSGQIDKAILRFLLVLRYEPGNLDAMLLLAEAYEHEGEKTSAITWYRNSLKKVNQPEVRAAIEQRIKDLMK